MIENLQALINLSLDADGLLQSDDYLLVVGDFVLRQCATLPVLSHLWQTW